MNAKIIASMLLSVAAASARAGELSLAPSVVQLAGRPGQTTTQRLTLRNDTDLVLAFSMEARDVVVRGGKREMLAPGDIPASIAATAVFSERAVVVPPGASRSVDVTLTIPPGVGHRAVVALFRGTTRLRDGAAGATASLGTLLTFSLSDGVSLSASELRAVPQSASANTTFEATFVNDGAEPLVPRGVAVVLDAAGALVARAPFDARRVLPGESVTMHTELSAELRPGEYRALATFEYAGRSLTRTARLDVR